MMQLKDILKGKQLAFRKGDKKGLKAAQCEINKDKGREMMLQEQAGEQLHREQCQAVLEGEPDDHRLQTTAETSASY